MRKSSLVLLILFIISTPLYYSWASPDSNTQDLENYVVKRVIDGDTIELNNSQKVRLKGINTPEKSLPLSINATNFLKEKIENKTIQLENHGLDKYHRILGYIFYNDQNLNKEILIQGLATLYYYEEDNHFNELKNAEEFARLNQLGLWESSPNSHCIELLELKYEESPKRCSNDELLKLKNNCNYDLEVIIKDDATHIYKETIKANQIFEKSFSCIWNNDGDTLYIFEEKGLITFHRY